MPGNPLDQTVSLSGAEQVLRQLQTLATSGGASLDKLSQSAEHGQAGFDKFGGSINAAAALISNARENITHTTEQFEGITEALAVAAPALTAFFGIASAGGLFELAQSAAESVDNINNMSVSLGTTAKEFQSFQFAMASVGQETNLINGALLKMQVFLGSTDDAIRKLEESSASLALQQKATADSADLAVAGARVAAINSANAYTQSRQAIIQAQVAVDKAAISYDQLHDKVQASNATGKQAQINAIQLRDAQLAYQGAVNGVTNAQQRSTQALNDAYLASRRVALADEQRRAALAKIEEEQTKGLTSTQQFLKDIGVASATSTEGTTNAVQAFLKIRKGLDDISDAAEKARIERDIFGRGFATFADALQAPLEEITKAIKEFDELGFAIDKTGQEATDKFRSALFQFQYFVEAIRNFAGLQLAEKVFTPLIEALNKWIIANAAGLKNFFSGFADALHIIGQILSVLVIPTLNKASAAFHALALITNGVASIINAAFGTQITGPTIVWLALIAGASYKFAGLLGTITGLTRLLGLLNTLWVGGGRALAIYTAEGYSLAAALGIMAARLGAIGLLASLVSYDLNHWDEIVAGNTAAVNGFLVLLQSLWGYIRDTIILGFNLWAEDAANVLAAITGYFQGWADSTTSKVKSVSDFFKDAWNGAISFVEGLWNDFVNWVIGVADGVIAAFKPVYNFLKGIADLISSIGGSSTTAADSAGGYAGGGAVRGPGTATSDSIPAYLSNGEFVVNAASVARVGLGFMHALNSGRTAFMRMGGVVRAALGGFVGGPQRFASGGYAMAAGTGNPGGHSIVNLHLDGRSFSLMGERGVVQALTGAARKAGITSTGRAPSWKR